MTTALTTKAIANALNAGNNLNYTVTQQQGETFVAECGSLGMNILCGCCAQYYKYVITVGSNGEITFYSDVPCGGWWGGAIGAAKTKNETQRVEAALAGAFAGRTVRKMKK